MFKLITNLICVAALIFVGAGCVADKTAENPYEDTIGPMTSVEGPGEDFQMDLEVADVETDVGTDDSPFAETAVYNPVVLASDPMVEIVDEDLDQVDDGSDNCVGWHNPDQVDTDHDGLGNTCDATPFGDGTVDYDHDGITDLSDNCPEVYNPDQGEC